jgi:hypothetical protein
MLTLVANSRGTELERREVGAARLGKRRSVCPGCDSQEVDCDRRDDMLQAGFDKTPTACAAQSTAAERLGVGAFDAGPRYVGLPEILRCLSRSHLLERFMKIAGLEADDTWLLLRSCALGARGRPQEIQSLYHWITAQRFSPRTDIGRFPYLFHCSPDPHSTAHIKREEKAIASKD